MLLGAVMTRVPVDEPMIQITSLLEIIKGLMVGLHPSRRGDEVNSKSVADGEASSENAKTRTQLRAFRGDIDRQLPHTHVAMRSIDDRIDAARAVESGEYLQSVRGSGDFLMDGVGCRARKEPIFDCT